MKTLVMTEAALVALSILLDIDDDAEVLEDAGIAPEWLDDLRDAVARA